MCAGSRYFKYLCSYNSASCQQGNTAFGQPLHLRHWARPGKGDAAAQHQHLKLTDEVEGVVECDLSWLCVVGRRARLVEEGRPEEWCVAEGMAGGAMVWGTSTD